MIPEPSLRGARDRRIAELETRIRRSSAVGVKIPVALMAMLLSGGLLFLDRKEIAYFFTSRSPIDLGSQGQYRWDQLKSNRYAQIHGAPTWRGAYGRDKKDTFVLVGLVGTPIVVRRRALAGEDWRPGTTPPQPNQTPFNVRGRLLSAEDAGMYRDGLAMLHSFGEMSAGPKDLWILVEGERPGSKLRAVLTSAVLTLFLLANAALLWRAIAERFEG